MDALHALMRGGASPPPAPPEPPAYVLEDNVPDILTFMGFTVYAASLFFALTEYTEHVPQPEETPCPSPVFLFLGLSAGVVSYSYALFLGIQLESHLHTGLTTLAFVCFAKHLARRAHLSVRRASTVIATAALPLLSLTVLEAGKVRVRNARFFFALMVALSAMPLPRLFRDWIPVGMGGSHTPTRERLFWLFFFAFAFVFVSTPLHSRSGVFKGDARLSVVVFFDLVCVYFALDGLWGVNSESRGNF